MNIKKIAIASFCGAMISTSAFAGFFLDAGIGAGKTKVTLEAESGQVGDWSKTGLVGGISAGYELNSESQMKYSVGFSVASQKLNLDEAFTEDKTPTFVNSGVMFYDLFVRAKYSIDNKHSVYGTLGFTASSNDAEIKFNGVKITSDTASSAGFLVGVGYELSMNQKLKFFTEANFRKTDAVSVEGSQIGVNDTSTFVTIGARYYF